MGFATFNPTYVRLSLLFQNGITQLIVPECDATIKAMRFDWDENKAASNLSKHGVSFEEAKTIFDDPLYADFYDPDHSGDEERYLIVGESNRGRLLITSYTEKGDLIRLISAREVTRTEREVYEER